MSALEQVLAALPAGIATVEADTLEAYRRDEARFVDAGTPAVVVRPRTTAEVVEAVRAAASGRMPIVARGAGSGLSGGANAIDGCMVLCLEAMTEVGSVDRVNQLVTVQPGALTIDVDRAARAVGLFYPPDPASREFCSIGGNIATNAGGLCCVKYGVTGDYVMGLEVVLADGSVLRTGRRSRKGVAGYDLTRLFVGSEGTLGIVTGTTLRLRPVTRTPATLVATFASLADAAAAVAAILPAVVPSMLELLDRTTVRAIESWQPLGLDTDAAVMLLARSDAVEQDAELLAIEAACMASGATMVVRSDDEAEAELLMTARRLAYPALQHLGPVLLDDVAVPPGAITDLLAGIERIGDEATLVIGTFGHVGDGNMHPTIVTADADEQTVLTAFDAIVALALSLGGTVTGEHGIGVLKRRHLRDEIGQGGIAVHRAIKTALDPHGLLNPGKGF